MFTAAPSRIGETTPRATSTPRETQNGGVGGGVTDGDGRDVSLHDRHESTPKSSKQAAGHRMILQSYIQGRNREINMGEPPFLCTTETAVAVRLSQHHGHWKALEIVFSLIHNRFF